jgi:uncharacterized membrane protein YidH (DUF202 family)
MGRLTTRLGKAGYDSWQFATHFMSDLNRTNLDMTDWHKKETYKSLIKIGTSALRFVLLANGGAAVAVLAFVGKVYHPSATVPNVAPSLGWFLAGVFIGGIAHFTAYMTQLALYNEDAKRETLRWYQHHEVWLGLSVALVVFGVVCFGIGAWCGVTSIAS